MDPRPLSVACLVIGIVVYGGAVSGAFFAHATPPADLGALSMLVSFLLFGGLGFALVRRSRVPA
jgi:hypothetical protein